MREKERERKREKEREREEVEGEGEGGTSIYSATSIFAFDVPSVDVSLFFFNHFDAGDALCATSIIHLICIIVMKLQFQRLCNFNG